MEIWKPVLGHEEYYHVSNLGNVKNLNKNKFVAGDKNSVGYRRVDLYKPFLKRYFVHRLVAMHFCEGYYENLVVNHIDGNKTNNTADNLEWITRSQNDKHAYKLNLRKANNERGVAQIDLNTREVLNEFESIAEAKRTLGLVGQNICAVCKGERSQSNGFYWKYI